MWYVAIVLIDIERNELSHGFDGVEVVQVQPLMLEHYRFRLEFENAPI